MNANLFHQVHWIPEVPSVLLWLALNELDTSIEIRETFAIDARVFETGESRAAFEEALWPARVRANALLEALRRSPFRHLLRRYGTSSLIEHPIVDAASAAPLSGNFFDTEMLACWLGWPPKQG
jgi:hypothetical protein